ncbi:MAG TPA: hypothetical protein PLW78_04005 [bacterium]|jgi:CO dehydrogenase/acetyl-CoA synthase beta subunit|nr:hypothetical protein [bacterium]HNZ52777.1 hypothetical protein [bacterium]HPG36412.1 hypothetical protein [bacterium]HPM48064.1 hypothetical protein [bacterium]HRQ69449.1 hypothetical protein [bacterium]
MKKLIWLAVLFSMFFSVSCNKKYIKGTEIEENEDSKTILKIFAHYVKGFKDQNPDLFVPYISSKYYDNNGTDDASDDVDYDRVVEMLNSEQFKSLEKVEVVYILKDLKIDKKENKGKLLFYFEVRFKMTSKLPPEEGGDSFYKPDGKTNHKISEHNQMKFVKEDGGWMIVSGL